MKRAHWMYSCLLVAAVVTAVQANTFFVDAVAGNDSNPGTAADAAFQTIRRAVNAAHDEPGPDVIRIGKGEYSENLTIDDVDGVSLAGKGGVLVVADDSDKDVIKVSAGDVSISDLAVTGGNRGVSATGSAEKPVSLSLRDVTAVDNDSDGLRATNVVNVSVSQSTFLANGGTAVRVQTADSVTVSQCTLQDNSGRGLRAEDVRSVVVFHCYILDNDDDGIKIVTAGLNPADASVSISDTTISGSADDGIDLEDLGDVGLAQLTIDGSGDDGVAVDNSSSVSVVGGAYFANSGDGIDIDDVPSIRLVSVVSTDNSASGVQVTAEGDCDIEWVSVVDGDFTGNSLDGIRILEEGTVVQGASLSSVTAGDNGERGLNVVVTGSVKLSAITSENNGLPDLP